MKMHLDLELQSTCHHQQEVYKTFPNLFLHWNHARLPNIIETDGPSGYIFCSKRFVAHRKAHRSNFCTFSWVVGRSLRAWEQNPLIFQISKKWINSVLGLWDHMSKHFKKGAQFFRIFHVESSLALIWIRTLCRK